MQRRYTDPSWALGALDPLGRAPLFVADNPYVYAGANPLSNVDPSGQRVMGASASRVTQLAANQAGSARVRALRGAPRKLCASDCKAGHVLNDAIAARGAFEHALAATGALAAVGTMIRFSFAAVQNSILEQVMVGGMAAVAGELALGWLAFNWEASQPFSWFERRGNVDAFFATAEAGIFAISVLGFVGALTDLSFSVETPIGWGAGAFAIGLLVSAEGVVTAMDTAQKEQDGEYNRKYQ